MKSKIKFILIAILFGSVIGAAVSALTPAVSDLEPTAKQIEEARRGLLDEAKQAHENEFFNRKAAQGTNQ